MNAQVRHQLQIGVVAPDGFRRLAILASCRAHGLPPPSFEVPVCPGRRWRFDLAWIRQKVAVEIQGGLFSGGRHVRGAALLKEYEKLNTACLLGWKVLLFSPKQIDDGSAFAFIRRILEGEI